MQFALSDEESLIAETATRIATERLRPLAAALDEDPQGARPQFLNNLKFLAENGFMGLNVAPEFGGSGAGAVAFALAIEKLAEGCAATAGTASVTNMVAEVIQAVAAPEQKSLYLPKLTGGDYAAGAFCLTEPHAGSDPSDMRTRAVREGDSWVLDGEKCYITSAEYAGLFVVWAVTDPKAPKGRGISVFLVEAGTKGLVVGRPERKMGQHGASTNTVTFEACRIPGKALMHKENDGFRIAVGELAGGRIGIAAQSLGIARAAMAAAKAYVLERRQFGQRIADFQGIQWMIADREVDLEAARLLLLNAAHLKDQRLPFAKAASIAKLFASEAAQRATDTAIQLFGGAGYMRDSGVERLARDARVTRIYEGTSEIQRHIIAREVLRGN